VTENLRSVVDMVAERPDVDSTPFFDGLWDLAGELRARIDARFRLEPDPSSEPFHAYGTGDGPRGSLRTFAGDEIDWLVHSWVGNPQSSFTNVHLSVWLGAQVDVPHLAYAFGTMPDLWFYIDLPPRADLDVEIGYLDRYYAPANETWLAIRERPELTVFTSRSIEVREQLSPTAYCYLAPREEASLELIRSIAHAEMDRWFGYLDAAEPVPAARRDALAARDLAYRRIVAERDPANVIAERAFGDDLADGLVRMLWGGGRVLPRAHGGG
jgi:hypothetical protein